MTSEDTLPVCSITMRKYSGEKKMNTDTNVGQITRYQTLSDRAVTIPPFSSSPLLCRVSGKIQEVAHSMDENP